MPNNDFTNDEPRQLIARQWYNEPSGPLPPFSANSPGRGGSDPVLWNVVSGNSPDKNQTTSIRHHITKSPHGHAYNSESTELQLPGSMPQRTDPRPNAYDPMQSRNAHRGVFYNNGHNFSRSGEVVFGPAPGPVDDHSAFQPFHNVSRLDLSPYETIQQSGYTLGWESESPMSSRPGSGVLRASSSRPRTRITPRHQHHQYLDTLLRSKCPKDRLEALDIAIRFRNEHPSTEPIPNELLDELMEPTDGDKFYCFCCPRAKKARTVTPARDHVRKSLGNFPFQCPNSWCHHSSLRQADLNKHMRTCTKQ